jgi:beta-lactamase regulating signal transducer with metallopeptidase domain
MFWCLAQHVATATILAGVIAFICRWARLGPALRHGLWLLVLVKLLVPPFVYWPWALPVAGQFFQEEPTVLTGEQSADESGSADQLLKLFLKVQARQSNEPHADGDLDLSPAAATRRLPAWLTPVLVSVWLAGSVAMAMLQCVRMVRFRRLLKEGRTPPRKLVRQVGALATLLSVRPPGTMILSGIGSPFVWGLHRAQLLWPKVLLGRLAEPRWRSVIAHELAHLRRRDHWVAVLQMLAECVWWWNPLFWYVRGQLRLNAELACDAWVVASLPEDRRAYAEALIEVTEHVSQTASLAPALGMSGGARQAFERRLTMIMGERVPCKVPVMGIVALGLLGLVALPGWSQVQTLKVQATPKQQSVDVRNVETILLDDVQSADVRWLARQGGLIELTIDDESQGGQVEKSGAAANRERKLRELEQKIQALRKELDTLRAKAGDPVRWRVTEDAPPEGKKPKVDPKIYGIQVVPTIELKKKLVAPEVKGFRLEEGQGKATIELKEAIIRPDPQVVVDNPDKIRSFEPKRLYVRVAPPEKLQYKVEPPQEGFKAEIILQPAEGKRATLSRATYRLPRDKAEALSAFLKDNVKAPVLETNVDGDSLTVTTTPEVQATIGAFVALVHGKGGPAKQKRIVEDPQSMRLWLESDDGAGQKKAEDVLFFIKKLEAPKKDQPRP